MKRTFLSFFAFHRAARSLLLGSVCFVGVSISAQAQTLTSWTVGYLHGGADDFDVKDTTRLVLRPVGTIRQAHAYFTSTVTSLDTNHLYTVSGNMWEGWWTGGTPYDPIASGKRDKFLVSIEVIGGLGAPTTDGRASLNATNTSPVYAGYPDLIYYATDTPATYSVQQKPDASGKIEVRLHYDKIDQVIYDKNWMMYARFSNVSVTP